MEREPFVIATTDAGRIAVSPDAIAQIVGAAAAESYGVVALAGRGSPLAPRPVGHQEGRRRRAPSRRPRRRAPGRRGARPQARRGAETGPRARAVRARADDRAPIASLEVHIDGVRGADGARSRPPPDGAALQNLEAHRRRIDDLNVYPVPDGDTGTNLVLTLRSIVEALDTSTAATSEDVAKDVTRAALMGARGNSGVIFSQIVRGFVEVLGRSRSFSAPLLRRAFRGASDTAYRAVKRPVEGTMLTVIREMAEECEKKEHRRLAPEELLRVVLARGEDALARTPEMLDVLRNAGVVDAGGAGLVEITRGLVAGATGEELPEAPVADRGARTRRDPPRALGVPLLHGVRRRGRQARQGRPRGRARADRRLPARRR